VEPDSSPQKVVDWLSTATLPVADLNDLAHIRRALQALGRRLDGKAAASNTLARKRAIFHGALDYAVELGLLPANPLDRIKGKRRTILRPVDDREVANPEQVRAILAEIAKDHPDLVALFGCLYFAARRPLEAPCSRPPRRRASGSRSSAAGMRRV
jgi:integrase